MAKSDREERQRIDRNKVIIEKDLKEFTTHYYPLYRQYGITDPGTAFLCWLSQPMTPDDDEQEEKEPWQT